MKNLSLSILFVGILIVNSFAQNSNLEFSFSALDSLSYIQLDSIKVINRSQGGETMLYWPDTTISMTIITGDTMLFIGYTTDNPVGIEDPFHNDSYFQLLQNYPNPVIDQSTISMYIPNNGNVEILVTDLQGSLAYSNSIYLAGGKHDFHFSPGMAKMYFFSAKWEGITSSIKILSTQQSSQAECRLEYIGNTEHKLQKKHSAPKYNTEIIRESGILDTPEESKAYTFQFMKNAPCPGTPTVIYGGQLYNTVQILSQCWLKENLNIGTMISGEMEMTDNAILEKYCYDNNQDSCNKYGGLYLWDEMMLYTTAAGSQGICPTGWHLPTDEEWKILEGGVDSQYGIGDPEWDISKYYRGFDAGDKLKATNGWRNGGNGSDESGFRALPGGVRWFDGMNYFHTGGLFGNWWSSSQVNTFMTWLRSLGYEEPVVHRMPSGKDLGYSVRCLKDI